MREKTILPTLRTKISALDVAKYFLNKANTEGDLVTNLKMQKLLYYAQAWYLVNYNAPLFKEPIRPWALGPVIKEVYDEFKEFGYTAIIYKSTGKESNIFSEKQIHYLDEFYDVFSKFTAHELVNMSHNESPWKDAHQKRKGEISLDAIKEYYTQVLEANQKNAKKR
jgi:uncharacterized phage-associated protein